MLQQEPISRAQKRPGPSGQHDRHEHPMPPVVDISVWGQAIADQQQLEATLAEHANQVAAASRRLPMTSVQGDYTFTGPEGEVTFPGMFAGKRQLVVYHFMFGPGEIQVVGDQILHIIPYGMHSKGDDSPEGWPQTFTIY